MIINISSQIADCNKRALAYKNYIRFTSLVDPNNFMKSLYNNANFVYSQFYL